MTRVSWMLVALSCTALTACATSPLGRKQLMLVGDDQMNQMGAQAFQEVSQQTPVDEDPVANQYVQCVARAVTQAAQDQTQVSNWDIRVFKSDQVNAFALPGGKIGVYTGLLKVAKTPGQLAAVLAHETGHVIAKHSAERVSEQTLEGGALTAVSAFLGGGGSSASNNLIMAALGVGTQVGVALPHSRTQEAEADLIGEDLMAKAGFDPKEAVDLWRNMTTQAGGGKPPEILSDHPADEKRIEALQQRLPHAEQIYAQAKAAGRNPKCKPPSSIR